MSRIGPGLIWAGQSTAVAVITPTGTSTVTVTAGAISYSANVAAGTKLDVVPSWNTTWWIADQTATPRIVYFNTPPDADSTMLLITGT